MKLMAISSREEEDWRLEEPLGKILARVLGLFNNATAREMGLEDAGCKGGERVPRKEVFIG